MCFPFIGHDWIYYGWKNSYCEFSGTLTTPKIRFCKHCFVYPSEMMSDCSPLLANDSEESSELLETPLDEFIINFKENGSDFISTVYL